MVQPGLWAILVYRFGRWTLVCPTTIRKPMHALYFAAYSIVRLLTGIDIPRGAIIGRGLMIHHFGGIIVHPEARIGARCTMRHGITIGNRRGEHDIPVIGDDVEIGAGAQILGRVRVSNGVTIGAMSLLLTDVDPGRTVAGIPAQPI